MMLNLKRPLLRGPALILGVGMCFAALGALGTVYGIWTSRDVAIRQNETRLLATAHMLNAHAIQSLEAADMMLRRVNDNLKELHGLDEAEFQEAVSSEHIFDMMRAATHGVPQVAGISLIANNGRLLNFTRQFPPPDLSLHDQDYFLSHAADPQLNLFIGRLTKNRITHAPYFYVARK